MPSSAFVSAAMPGINKIADTLSGANYTDAYNKALMNNATIAQRLSEAALNQEKLTQERSKAEQEAQQALARSPKARTNLIVNQMMARGLTATPGMVDTARSYGETGKWGPDVQDYPPEDQAGPPSTTAAPAPDWSNTPVGRAIFRGLSNLQAYDNTGGKIDDYAKAVGEFGKQDATQNIIDSIQSGQPIPLDTQNRIVTAMSGKEYTPYKGGDYGVTNEATGVQTRDPIIEKLNQARTLTEGTRQAQERAAATASYASAENSRATAAKTRQETDLGRKGTYDSTRGIIVDPVTGQARQVTMNGEPVGTKASSNPLPASAVKLQNEELQALGTFKGIDSDLAALEKQMTDGKLRLGLVNNIENSANNFLGRSTEQSRNFASFKAKLESMRNAILLLNKGVQTEGDAKRAMNEIISNPNDQNLVLQRLRELRALNQRAATLRKNNVDVLRSNYGQPGMDYGQYENQPATVGINGNPSNPPANGRPPLDSFNR